MTGAVIYVQSVCTGNITNGHLIATTYYPEVEVAIAIGIKETSVHIFAYRKTIKEGGVRLKECPIMLLDHQRSGLTPGAAHVEIIEPIFIYVTHRHFRTARAFFVWN